MVGDWLYNMSLIIPTVHVLWSDSCMSCDMGGFTFLTIYLS